MNVEIIDTEHRRRNIAAVYRQEKLGTDGYWHGRADAGIIYERLVPLGNDPSWDAIKDASHGEIGPGWLACGLCGKNTLDGDRLTQIVALLGAEDYGDDSAYFNLCFACIKHLAEQVAQHERPGIQ